LTFLFVEDVASMRSNIFNNKKQVKADFMHWTILSYEFRFFSQSLSSGINWKENQMNQGKWVTSQQGYTSIKAKDLNLLIWASLSWFDSSNQIKHWFWIRETVNCKLRSLQQVSYWCPQQKKNKSNHT
jgi:hypothetical protein